MLCLIAKHLLSDSYGLFDRFLEIGVFLLIAYEIGVGIVRHRRTTKRKKELDRTVATLSRFMGEGQKIQREIPEQYDALAIREWKDAVNTWGRDTHGFLEKCSPRAAAAFVLIAGTGVSANPQLVYRESGSSFEITGSLRESYQKLVAQLSNLRSIMEKPEAYF